MQRTLRSGKILQVCYQAAQGREVKPLTFTAELTRRVGGGTAQYETASMPTPDLADTTCWVQDEEGAPGIILVQSLPGR